MNVALIASAAAVWTLVSVIVGYSIALSAAKKTRENDSESHD